jgi:outer membrane protein assembly factor BamA
MPSKLSACLALACALAVPCAAQRKHAAPAAPAAPADPSPTDKIKVDAIKYTGTGATDYSESDFAAATGISVGVLTNADIQDAASKLANSGQFGEVGFAMDGNTLTFTITAAEKLLPVHFENFVWWTDIDLLRDVHAKCPLFLGTLAGKGTLLQQVTDTLTAMAAERAGAGAKVEQNLIAHPGQPPYAVGFAITSPAIVVGRVDLAHASMEMSATVAQVSHKLVGQPYNRDAAKEYLLSRLGEAYAAQGYINLSIKEFQASDPKPSDKGIAVTVQGNLDSGKLYHVAALNWTDTPQMSKAAFDALDALKVGDVAALAPLETTLHSIERSYQHQGYVNAKATATPTLDHENATVSYTFSVVPGTAFHTSE